MYLQYRPYILLKCTYFLLADLRPGVNGDLEELSVLSR